MNAARSRRGFTLVELLVVMGLLAALFALVLGGLGRPSVATNIRRTAQDLASRLLSTQSRALGKPEGAALIIAPDAADARMGTAIVDAVTQPWITGPVTGMPPSDPRQTSVAVTVTAASDVLASAYKIRFQASPTNGQLSPGASPWFAYASGAASFRASAGQTLGNTIWPKTASQANEAVIARYPTPVSSGEGNMAKQVAIDLRHSGMGEDPAASHGYGRFEGTGSIALAYEQVGRVGEVMRRVQEARTSIDQPIDPNGVIYFLVVLREDIQAGRNTLANAQSVWVAINPQTGRVTVAENIPQSAEDKAALSAARANARAGVALK
jgi:prepilin-type N-terminal cleavage/methylation domain-containing protein